VNARDTFLDALVMMVDDEPLAMEVTRVHLAQAGYSRFVCTANALEAVEMVVRERPDVLLLDLMMPGLTGLEILDRMEREHLLKDVPTIVLTASRDRDDKLKALQLGATEFLMKPVDPAELVLRVRNTLAAREYWRSRWAPSAEGGAR
jgi:DNA-binding response OmpR family regulator